MAVPNGGDVDKVAAQLIADMAYSSPSEIWRALQPFVKHIAREAVREDRRRRTEPTP